MPSFSRKQFLRDIDDFCAAHSVAESRFGRDALGDPNFVSALRAGNRAPTIDTIEKVYSYVESKTGAADVLG